MKDLKQNQVKSDTAVFWTILPMQLLYSFEMVSKWSFVCLLF
jgi:hypothetical protein